MNMSNAIIFSGEGDYGSYRRHTCASTLRAINMALTRERCGGDRWARAFIPAGEEYVDHTYIGIDEYGNATGELRTITPDLIGE